MCDEEGEDRIPSSVTIPNEKDANSDGNNDTVSKENKKARKEGARNKDSTTTRLFDKTKFSDQERGCAFIAFRGALEKYKLSLSKSLSLDYLKYLDSSLKTVCIVI